MAIVVVASGQMPEEGNVAPAQIEPPPIPKHISEK